MDALKKFSPGFYVVIILCFLLPFVNLSCSGQEIMSLSGLQLITGSEVKGEGMFDGLSNMGETQENDKVDPQPLALFALISSVAGLGLSFIRKKIISLINVALSALGVIFLILLKLNLDGEAELSGQNVITLDYQLGYWLAVILFLGSAVIQWLVFREE